MEGIPMTTSANVVEFLIYKDGKQVGHYHQHALCRTRWYELLKFLPIENHEIMPYGYDEEEDYWEGEKINLREFLKTREIELIRDIQYLLRNKNTNPSHREG
jgi:hypothetical protein